MNLRYFLLTITKREFDTVPINGVKRVQLDDIDEVENVIKWFTNDERSTIKDRTPLAVLAAALIAATTSKVDVTIPMWNKACLKELDAMSENQTFSLVKLPAGKRAVGCRWVFTMKNGPTGEFAKARLVAQGFSQQEGIDYNETFSLVITYDSVRVLLLLVLQTNLRSIKWMSSQPCPW